MEISGKIIKIYDTQVISSSFQKREFVITTEEVYPQHIILECTQDKIAILDNVSEGENVKVSINIRGREWTNPQGELKYFNSIQAWRIEKIISQAVFDNSQAYQAPTPPPTLNPSIQPSQEATVEEDDLPF